MTATARFRGHPVWFDEATARWRLTDRDGYREGWDAANAAADPNSIRCIKCGQLPTPEGYDPCLGFIEGARSACCGHGVEEPYVVPSSAAARYRVAFAIHKASGMGEKCGPSGHHFGSYRCHAFAAAEVALSDVVEEQVAMLTEGMANIHRRLSEPVPEPAPTPEPEPEVGK